MKFWQLASIARNALELLQVIASTREEWEDIGRWYAAFDDLVQKQDRAHLDLELPDDYVFQVLESISGTLYLDDNGWLRSRQCNPTDTRISFLEGYRKYGADALEETLERGAITVLK